MSYIKVEGHTSLVREKNSNGIVNTDTNAYTIYMQRVREVRKSNNDLRNACREINNLKAELTEIKQLLGKLVK
jgi:hypothetical protein|tara:strand:- start:556 stop:774 length:219 start_codon:yes stop_codon:yes gene_type:complete